MKRHLQNLQRLCQKLQNRYGKDDDLVVKLTREIETIQAIESSQSRGWHQKRHMQEMSTQSAPIQ